MNKEYIYKDLEVKILVIKIFFGKLNIILDFYNIDFHKIINIKKILYLDLYT